MRGGTMKFVLRWCVALVLCGLCVAALGAQTKRKVIIDQDCAGPGGTDMQAILALVNSPETEVLGITVLTGDAWRDEEVAHALRLLEIVGRADIPVVPGAVFPLVRTQPWTELWQRQFGKVEYLGAWGKGPGSHDAYQIPPMKEGAPMAKALTEDAAHFLLRMVRKY